MSSNRKRKRCYYISSSNPKKAKSFEELKSGLKGFLITCGSDERRTTLEAYALLNEYADKLYGPEIATNENESENDEDDDIEKSLKRQVDDLKSIKDRKRRFQRVPVKAKNIVFIRTSVENPSQLLLNIFNDIKDTQIKKTKKCLRFLPVMDTCNAKVEHILKTAKPIITKIFHEVSEGFTYSIMWKIRCNDSIKRDDILPLLIDYMNSVNHTHRTDYSNPNFVLHFDVVGPVCFISLLQDFFKYKKYNLDNLVAITDEKTLVDAKKTEEATIVDLNNSEKERQATDESIKTENKVDIVGKPGKQIEITNADLVEPEKELQNLQEANDVEKETAVD